MILILIKFLHDVKKRYTNTRLKDMYRPRLFVEFGSGLRKSLSVNIAGQMWQPSWSAISAALGE